MLNTAEIFSDNMVLQRDKPLKIWGNTRPGSVVTVEIQGKKGKTQADENGKWELTLPELKVSFNEQMCIRNEEKEIVYNNVSVGEVWIAAGQSNMEFFMYFDKDYYQELCQCNVPDIRFWDQPVYVTDQEKKTKKFEKFGFWRICNSDNLKYYSAVAYYFARNLQYSLDVPIGIIGCNCGGTRACCWMDEDSVKKSGDVWLKEYELGLAKIENKEKMEQEYWDDPFNDKENPFKNPLLVQMMRGLPKEKLIELFSNRPASAIGNVIGPWHEWRPCGLYYTMLKCVMPYTIRGILWYQGESDELHPYIYADMMCGLINCWRSGWGDELPFLMVQLAPLGTKIELGGKYYPIIRQQQEEVTKRLTGVYCASIGDVGSEYDIHPKEKRAVGIRLALLARGHIYGEKILCDAPVPNFLQREKRKISIDFDNAEGGLVLNGMTINNIDIFPEMKIETAIQESKIIITLPESAADQKVKISFARTPYYEINVLNQSGIPVKPFTVEI